jgi:hypothetical protein
MGSHKDSSNLLRLATRPRKCTGSHHSSTNNTSKCISSSRTSSSKASLASSQHKGLLDSPAWYHLNSSNNSGCNPMPVPLLEGSFPHNKAICLLNHKLLQQHKHLQRFVPMREGCMYYLSDLQAFC